MRRRVSLEVDENLADAARLVAERAGVPEDELYERALRQVLVGDFQELMNEIETFQASRGLQIDEEESIRLANEELGALRAKRRNAS